MLSDNLVLDMGDGSSLRECVYKFLKTAIMNGDLEAEERLMEIPLANKLGVSRTPVREAIKDLADEHLVVIIPRCGAKVAGITGKDVADALAVRNEVERMAVRLACTLITGEDIKRLRSYTDIMSQAAKDKDLNLLSRMDSLFHTDICKITDNAVLVEIMAAIEAHVIRYRVEYYKARGLDVDKVYKQHYDIIDALEKHDVQAAEEAMTRHITEIMSVISNISK